MVTEPIAVTLIVVKAFESLAIPYMIGGSFASTAYGRYRTTMDVDFVANLQIPHVEPFTETLRGDFYIDANMIRSSIQHRTSFNLIHLQTMFKVDIFIPKSRPFDQEQLARRVKRVISVEPKREAYFATAEDTILAKLEWFQMSGETSERQWRDLYGILQVQAEQVDLDYLRKWADDLHVRPLLERALADTDSRNKT